MPTNPDDPNDTFPLKFRTPTKSELREMYVNLFGIRADIEEILVQSLRREPTFLVDPAQQLSEEWERLHPQSSVAREIKPPILADDTRARAETYFRTYIEDSTNAANLNPLVEWENDDAL